MASICAVGHPQLLGRRVTGVFNFCDGKRRDCLFPWALEMEATDVDLTSSSSVIATYLSCVCLLAAKMLHFRMPGYLAIWDRMTKGEL